VTSKAGANSHPPPWRRRKAKFLVWSSWLTAMTLNTIRRYACWQVLAAQPERFDALQVLVIAVGPGHVEVEVRQCTERDHMMAFAGRPAVKPTSHEMTAWPSRAQTGGHLDAGGVSHEAVGVLGPTIGGALT